MDDQITHPQISSSNQFPLWYRIYLQLFSASIRSALRYMSKDPGLHDFEERVPTPNLGSGTCLVRVFLPVTKGIDSSIRTTLSSESDLIPLFIHLEGGGFVMGAPADSSFNLRYLADSCGAAVVSVDYAKAPTHPFPHALLQIPHVITWACRRLPVSANRVAIGGNSAGGNLSAAFSLLSSAKRLRSVKFSGGSGRAGKEMEDSPLNSLPEDFKLRSQILIVPSVHQDASYALRKEDSTSEEMSKASLPVWAACPMEDAYLPPPIDRKSPFVAPAMISETMLEAFVEENVFPSRALVITGGLDCLSVEGGAYAEKLRKAGVGVEEKCFEGASHMFDHANGWDGKAEGMEADMAREALRLIAVHLDEVFNE